MYICHLIGIYTYLFGYMVIYLMLICKPAKNRHLLICPYLKNWHKRAKKKDSRFRMSPVMRGVFALGQIISPSTKRPLDQHPTIGRIDKAYSNAPSGLPLGEMLIGLLKVLDLIDLHFAVSCFTDRYPICLWSNHDN